MMLSHNDEAHVHLPNRERLSLLAAAILLAYALGQFIHLPAVDVGAQLPGFYLAVQVNVHTIVALIVAGMAASGANWLLRDHPAMRRGRMAEHWLLPALTAWAIGMPLFQMPPTPLWWIGFAAGGAALILVLVAEYIVVDPEDARRPLAAAGLTAAAFALYLVLLTALRFTSLRLFLMMPAVGVPCGLVSLRTLRLRIPQRWSFIEAGLSALITVQLAAALHYWPISPVTYGLALLGPSYALTTLLGNLAEGEPPRSAVIEPVVVLGLIWGVALWIR
ncbi:MAG: hypothetical protein QME21_10215 [Anaerolineales bacterium]|nr:hypothetical protein [Anaerolineales bacterium]